MRSDNSLLTASADSVLEGDGAKAVELARKMLEEGTDPLSAIENGFVRGLKLLGERWDAGECFLPELVAGASAAKQAISILQEKLATRDLAGIGRVVIGTIEGDIHDIGKTLVSAMLSAHGYEVVDLGADVKVERFLDEVAKREPDLLGVSALLTTTMLNQKKLIESLEAEGLRGRVSVLVGGAPTSRQWARQIGADGYAENAVEAVREAARLMEEKGK